MLWKVYMSILGLVPLSRRGQAGEGYGDGRRWCTC